MPSTHQYAVERLEISGFKSIRAADILLNDLNILIGANGSGKSNFIGLFRLLNELVERRLQVYSGSVGAESLFHFGSKVTPEMALTFHFGDNKYHAAWRSTAQDRLIFADEACGYHRPDQGYQHPIWYSIDQGHKETGLYELAQSADKGNRVARYVVAALQDWKVYHFHDTSAGARVKQTGSINDNESLRPDAANLAAFLYYLQQAERPYYHRIVRTIRTVAPFFDDFVLRPSPLNADNIRLEWKEKGSDEYFNANMLSDGTLRFICLAVLLMQPRLPSVILIDEPELGLHPYAIEVLAGMLRSAASETQVIVSTQSVPLINEFTPEDLLVADREDGQSVFRRLDSETLGAWLAAYSLGELWQKNVLGGRPHSGYSR